MDKKLVSRFWAYSLECLMDNILKLESDIKKLENNTEINRKLRTQLLNYLSNELERNKKEYKEIEKMF